MKPDRADSKKILFGGKNTGLKSTGTHFRRGGTMDCDKRTRLLLRGAATSVWFFRRGICPGAKTSRTG